MCESQLRSATVPRASATSPLRMSDAGGDDITPMDRGAFLTYTAVVSLPPVTTYWPGGSGKSGFSMIRPCSSIQNSFASYAHWAGAAPLAINCPALASRTPRGPGSTRQMPQDDAPVPDIAAGSPSAAMNCVRTRLNSDAMVVLALPDTSSSNSRRTAVKVILATLTLPSAHGQCASSGLRPGSGACLVREVKVRS